MPPKPLFPRRATARDFLYFRNPSLWEHYPFLPLVRRCGDRTDCGVLYDARGISGTFGYACAVFLVNLFDLPDTETQLLNGPRLVYDTFDELADDGWHVD